MNRWTLWLALLPHGSCTLALLAGGFSNATPCQGQPWNYPLVELTSLLLAGALAAGVWFGRHRTVHAVLLSLLALWFHPAGTGSMAASAFLHSALAKAGWAILLTSILARILQRPRACCPPPPATSPFSAMFERRPLPSP